MKFNAYQCPRTGAPLKPATNQQIVRINQEINQGKLFTMQGDTVKKSIEAGWLSLELNRCYPVRDSIVCLVVPDALDLSTLPSICGTK